MARDLLHDSSELHYGYGHDALYVYCAGGGLRAHHDGAGAAGGSGATYHGCPVLNYVYGKTILTLAVQV